jgi:hypothetical protein
MSVKVVPERSGLASAHTRDVYYEYDLRGLQTKARFDSLSGEGVSSSYDGFGRLSSSSIDMGGTTRTLSAQHNKSGGRTELAFPDNVKMSFAHDGLDRMTGVLEGALGSGVLLGTIAYDSRGQRASMTRRGGDATSYAFDGVSRLKTLGDAFTGSAGNSSSAFGYNPASQITSLARARTTAMHGPGMGAGRGTVSWRLNWRHFRLLQHFILNRFGYFACNVGIQMFFVCSEAESAGGWRRRCDIGDGRRPRRR